MSDPTTRYLDGFKGRNAMLRSVIRYNIREVMFYRTNLLTHSLRSMWLTRELNQLAVKVFGRSYDPLRAELLALVHDDDPEIITGDHQYDTWKILMLAHAKGEVLRDLFVPKEAVVNKGL